MPIRFPEMSESCGNKAGRKARYGEAPVKIVDADPSVPQLEGAAFDIGEGKRDTFTDEEHNVTIKLLEKTDHSYEILITTAQQ